MIKSIKEETHQFVYDYFKNIEFTYDFLKEINGKTVSELTVEQYDYLSGCESWSCKVDAANNTSTEKYNFFENMGRLVCGCLESLGVCTMFLSYRSMYIELIGPTDDMDSAILKCNLLSINNYIEEIRDILLSLGFRL